MINASSSALKVMQQHDPKEKDNCVTLREKTSSWLTLLIPQALDLWSCFTYLAGLWILRESFEFSRWLCWEQSRYMADWLYTVGVGDILILVCFSACDVLIFILGKCCSSRHTDQNISITYCLMYVAALCVIWSPISCVDAIDTTLCSTNLYSDALSVEFRQTGANKPVCKKITH